MAAEAPAHRSISAIRPTPTTAGSRGAAIGQTTPASPHTPSRPIPASSFSSPSTLRAEEDHIIIEAGARFLRVGLAGDASPKAILDFGPDTQRRAGDYRQWREDHDTRWRERETSVSYGAEYELWSLDMRQTDLGLVGERLERALREAFTKSLLIDSRPRKMTLAMPSLMPLPLLSLVLDCIFTYFQPPTISLFPAPVLSTVAAGMRNALVIDIGWAETTVTSVYELREVKSWRSVRAGKMLGQEVHTMLKQHDGDKRSGGLPGTHRPLQDHYNTYSFSDCQEILTRVVWCRPKAKVATAESEPPDMQQARAELAAMSLESTGQSNTTTIPLRSTTPARLVHLPFEALSEPCEAALLAHNKPLSGFDDHELPLQWLIYRALLQLPISVRSLCMSRLVFTGGGSSIPGLKSRLIDEVQSMIDEHGFEPARGTVVQKLRQRAVSRTMSRNDGPTQAARSAALEDQIPDVLQQRLGAKAGQDIHGGAEVAVRAVESLGAWAGASLLGQLKVPAATIIEKDVWLAQGAAGASRGEVSVAGTAGQRQSLGPGTTLKAGEKASWTLGVWA